MYTHLKKHASLIPLSKLLIVCLLILFFGQSWVPARAENGDSPHPFKFDRVSLIGPEQGNERHNDAPPPVTGREHCRYRVCYDKIETEDTYQVVFTGSDLSGKHWRLTTAYYPDGTLLFTGDLDKNGVSDLVLLGGFGGCVGVGLYGVVPSTSFTAILFDKNGRPFPWGLLGSFGADQDSWQGKVGTPKIDELISFGTDNKACLFVKQFDPIKKRMDPADVWKADFYRAKNAHWDNVGTYRGNAMPTNDSIQNNQERVSLANKNFRYSHVRSFYISKDNHQHLNLSSGMTISNDSYVSALTPFIIHENKSSYEIASLGTHNAAVMLKRAVLAKSLVKYSASSTDGKRPEYIWLLD
jgi:hypothetical protein